MKQFWIEVLIGFPIVVVMLLLMIGVGILVPYIAPYLWSSRYILGTIVALVYIIFLSWIVGDTYRSWKG